MRFDNRRQAGRVLAEALAPYRQSRPLVLALPRGGVPVGYEVARTLDAPLDIFLVRKLGVPGQDEFAMGAIASGGVIVFNAAVASLDIPRDAIDAVIAREQHELARREKLYRGDRPPPRIAGRTVILVDDGLATGSTMQAAIAAVRGQDVGTVVVAVPVAAVATCEQMRTLADDVICAMTPEPFWAVGLWYDDFSQTTDAEVRALLTTASRAERAHTS